MTRGARRRTSGELNPASAGTGPLLQRDYWAVFDGCPVRPRSLAALVAERFCEFPPPELATFEIGDDGRDGLQTGSEMVIHIRGAGRCGVRVVHRDTNSITLLTLKRHPEAGRITFGAYPDARGGVVFHIRSRARASSIWRYAEFLVLGDAMQTNTWTAFINRLAAAIGCTIRGDIRADTHEAEPNASDSFAGLHEPTFIARGD